MDKVNINGLCGICLMESHSYLCIFESRSPDGSYIYEVMNDVCQLQITAAEESGNLICLECHTKLLNFNSFKREAQKARELFQQMKDSVAKVIIKEECVEEDPIVIAAEEPCNERVMPEPVVKKLDTWPTVAEVTGSNSPNKMDVSTNMQVDEPVCKQEEYFIENEENSEEEPLQWGYEGEPFERIRVKQEDEIQPSNAKTELEIDLNKEIQETLEKMWQDKNTYSVARFERKINADAGSRNECLSQSCITPSTDTSQIDLNKEVEETPEERQRRKNRERVACYRRKIKDKAGSHSDYLSQSSITPSTDTCQVDLNKEVQETPEERQRRKNRERVARFRRKINADAASRKEYLSQRRIDRAKRIKEKLEKERQVRRQQWESLRKCETKQEAAGRRLRSVLRMRRLRQNGP